MSNRKPIGAKLRFEVFKRDNFKCQYCGATSPDVILHIDHINPVNNGGENDVLNLITSCQICNLGKGKTLLDDKSSIEKQRKMLEELNERREQLEMLLQWREGLRQIDNETSIILADYIDALMSPSKVNDHGLANINTWLKKYSIEELLKSSDLSAESNLNGSAGRDVERFFKYIPIIAAFNRKPETERELRYIRGILRNRLSYVNDGQIMNLLKYAIENGWDIESLKDFVKKVTSWTEFRTVLEDSKNG